MSLIKNYLTKLIAAFIMFLVFFNLFKTPPIGIIFLIFLLCLIYCFLKYELRPSMTLIAFLGIVMVASRIHLDILNKYPSVKVFFITILWTTIALSLFLFFSPQQNGKRGRGNNEKHNNKQVS